MKKFLCFFSFFVLTALLTTGCKRENPVEAPQSVVNSSGIFLKANGATLPDSFNLENRTVVVFTLQASFAVRSWTTTFGDDGAQVNGDVLQHSFRTGIASTTITVVAIDQSNIPHQKIYKIILVANQSLPSVVWVSKRDLGNGSWEETFLFLKAVMQDFIGPYAYIGNNTTPTWSTTRFADTNKLFINNVVIDPPNGENGLYAIAKFINTPNPYDMGVGRIDTVTIPNILIWVPFDGPFADGNHIKYTVGSNGDVTPGGIIVNTLPGDIGDIGPNAVTRFGVKDSTKITILVNNFRPWESGSSFLTLESSNGLFLSPVLQTAAPGYTNYGKLDIPASSVPADGKFVYNYGNKIPIPPATPVFNTNAKLSSCWSGSEGMLKIIIKKAGLGKRVAGSDIQYWTVAVQK